MVQSKPELKEERDLFQEIVQGVKKMAGQREESPYVPRHIRQHIEQTAWADDAADALIEMGIYKAEDFHHVCDVVARLMRVSNVDEGGELMEVDAAKFMREYIRERLEE